VGMTTYWSVEGHKVTITRLGEGMPPSIRDRLQESYAKKPVTADVQRFDVRNILDYKMPDEMGELRRRF